MPTCCPRDRATIWLATAFAVNSLICVIMVAGLIVAGGTGGGALKTTAPGFSCEILGISNRLDSWLPMIKEWERDAADPVKED